MLKSTEHLQIKFQEKVVFSVIKITETQLQTQNTLSFTFWAFNTLSSLLVTVSYSALRFLQPEKFVNLGIEPPKGVLLFGPPGTGKTLCARAVANRTDACFIRVIGSELVQKYVGEVNVFWFKTSAFCRTCKIQKFCFRLLPFNPLTTWVCSPSLHFATR